MVLYSDIRNWINGNWGDIDRAGLISIIRYLERGSMNDDIEYDIETDEEYTSEYGFCTAAEEYDDLEMGRL